ncbi:MAG: hypothetical protein JWR18_4276 [Segetibacter sp.]|nr:hypothetical protein [Segetibacter sp.]
MKLYSHYDKASIKMTEDYKLSEQLQLLANENEINIIIESGTYLGTGSTVVLANAFENSSAFEKLYTCEVNWTFYKEAKKNLQKFSKVVCLYGRTVSFKDAHEFILSDDVLKNHSLYPEIYIDDIEDPTKFYLNELNGGLGVSNKLRWTDKLRKYLEPFKEGLLQELIKQNENKTYLIVLDSAGGIGYLEFLTIKKLLKDKNFYILLDDIHHLKHFRSFGHIKDDKQFEMMSYDLSTGWALAKHSTPK